MAGARAAASVANAVRARAVPRHADKEPPVMAEIRRPPVLAVRHQRVEVFLQRFEVELFELLCVVKGSAHWIGLGRVLPENPEVQLVRPPVAVRPHSNIRGPMHDRALRFACHVFAPSFRLFKNLYNRTVTNREPIAAFLFAQSLARAFADARHSFCIQTPSEPSGKPAEERTSHRAPGK